MSNDNNNCLFSQEEMERMEPNSLFNPDYQHKPVICLGMTFDSEDARREYFREELRKKLPELKQIEGFPIGEDDDIINLSDPPYYTACPNPWLNDFIEEWEKEKVVLEKEGKRKADFEVSEPYASDVKVGKNNPVYTAHTYHTKVPHPAIMRYILHYTQPGDIVFDGFAGTGMTGVAAQACTKPNGEIKDSIDKEWSANWNTKPHWGKRHSICGDLSPYASLVSYNYNTPTNSILLKQEVERIFKETKEKCKWMYTTLHEGKEIGLINYIVWSDVFICNSCGKEFVYWDAAIDRENKCLNDEFYCPHCKSMHTKKTVTRAFETVFDKYLEKIISACKTVPVIIVYTANNKRYEKNADKYDFDLVYRIKEIQPQSFVPTYELPDGFNTQQPKKAQNVCYVYQFYTNRNLIALSIFLDKIEKSKLPNKIKFIFTGMVNRSTKMNRIHVSNYFYGGGGWNAGHLKGTLYIPNLPIETSILEQIEDKLSSFLRAIPFLPSTMDNGLYVGSANEVPIRSNSVDYIFTDPPFGANIMYSELNILPESWLKVLTNNSTEAIINSGQNKSSSYYLDMMSRCYSEFFRILKPGKWMTVEFSNTSASIWNSIQQALCRAGFVVASVSALNKGQGGMRAITTTTAVKQDLAISCYKPSDKIQHMDMSDGVKNVWDFIEEHISLLAPYCINDNKFESVAERDQRILYDKLVSYFVQKGYDVPINSQDFQQGLRERFIERDGLFFTAAQVAEYDEKKNETQSYVSFAMFVNDEASGIQWLKNQLRDNPKTYQEIQPDWMQAINGLRKNNILPELKQILEENFIEMEGGKWRLPNIQDDVDKEALRTKSLLREFKKYVEAASKPKAKIKEARVEALRAGFKQCYIEKDFKTIVLVGDKIPQNLRDEDETLLQFYDIAVNKM